MSLYGLKKQSTQRLCVLIRLLLKSETAVLVVRCCFFTCSSTKILSHIRLFWTLFGLGFPLLMTVMGLVLRPIYTLFTSENVYVLFKGCYCAAHIFPYVCYIGVKVYDNNKLTTSDCGGSAANLPHA